MHITVVRFSMWHPLAPKPIDASGAHALLTNATYRCQSGHMGNQPSTHSPDSLTFLPSASPHPTPHLTLCWPLSTRYERMFDREVAQALLRHAFSGAGKTDEDVSEMVAAWCASKRERKSRVTEEQRARMYVDLVRKMDGLPAVFMRKAGSDEVVGLTETRLNL